MSRVFISNPVFLKTLIKDTIHMKHLDKINPNKFYTKLVLEGKYIQEEVSGGNHQ